MSKPKKLPCRKRNGKQISFDFKLSVIDEINTGRISVNYAALPRTFETCHSHANPPRHQSYGKSQIEWTIAQALSLNYQYQSQ
jgi:hypothetical protein